MTQTLSPWQKNLIHEYCNELMAQGDIFALFNAKLAAFKKMALALPVFENLGEEDFHWMLFQGLIQYQDTADAAKKAGVAPPDASDYLALYYMRLIVSLPREYIFEINLPSFVELPSCIFDIAPDIRLLHVPGEHNALAAAAASGIPQRRPPHMVLQIRISGYAYASLQTPGVISALARAKQVAFLLRTTDVVREVLFSTKARAALIDVATGKRENVSLPDGLAQMMGNLSLEAERLTKYDGGIILGGKEVQAETTEEQAAALTRMLAKTRLFFSRADRDGHDRIRAAIEWYQDSSTSQDQTIAFIAACIGLESIFGEEEEKPKGKGKGINELSRRLADRYAFMLGKDRAERKALIAEFDEITVLRGVLIHARAARLHPREREKLSRVREMLRRSIVHELRPFFSAD